MRLRAGLVAKVHIECLENGRIQTYWAAVEVLMGDWVGGGPMLRSTIVHEARGPMYSYQAALVAAKEFCFYLRNTPGAFAAHALDLEVL